MEACYGSYKLGDSKSYELVFKYCIIKKLHDKITTDYTLLLELCKKHWVKYGFGTISSIEIRNVKKLQLKIFKRGDLSSC